MGATFCPICQSTLKDELDLVHLGVLNLSFNTKIFFCTDCEKYFNFSEDVTGEARKAAEIKLTFKVVKIHPRGI